MCYNFIRVWILEKIIKWEWNEMRICKTKGQTVKILVKIKMSKSLFLKSHAVFFPPHRKTFGFLRIWNNLFCLESTRRYYGPKNRSPRWLFSFLRDGNCVLWMRKSRFDLIRSAVVSMAAFFIDKIKLWIKCRQSRKNIPTFDRYLHLTMTMVVTGMNGDGGGAATV